MLTAMLILAAAALGAAAFWAGRLVERRGWNRFLDWFSAQELATLESFVEDVRLASGGKPLSQSELNRAWLEQAEAANSKPL